MCFGRDADDKDIFVPENRVNQNTKGVIGIFD